MIVIAFIAFIAFSLAASFAIEGDKLLAFSNFGATLFAVFLYYNPESMLVKNIDELDALIPDLVEVKFLWAAVGIGSFGILYEIVEYLD